MMSKRKPSTCARRGRSAPEAGTQCCKGAVKPGGGTGCRMSLASSARGWLQDARRGRHRTHGERVPAARALHACALCPRPRTPGCPAAERSRAARTQRAAPPRAAAGATAGRTPAVQAVAHSQRPPAMPPALQAGTAAGGLRRAQVGQQVGGAPGMRAPSAPGRPPPGARPWRAQWRCCCSRPSCRPRPPRCAGGSTRAPACPALRTGCARLRARQRARVGGRARAVAARTEAAPRIPFR